MHYFSVHTITGEHLGFLVMSPDDESALKPESGQFAVKTQFESTPSDAAALAAWKRLENIATPLYWQLASDSVELSDGQTLLGRIRQEYLSFGGHTFLLNDLAGTF